MPDVATRPATLADLDGLLRSNVALFAMDAAARDPLRNAEWPVTHGREWLSSLIADPDALVLVADNGAYVAGHLIGTFSEPSDMWIAPRAELLSMHVDSTCRGQGVGAHLVAECVVWAKAHGAARLHVSAYAANDGAVRFYHANGFAPFSLELVQTL